MTFTRRAVLAGASSIAALAVAGCAGLPQIVVNAILPPAPPYPFADNDILVAEAEALSTRLARFIDAWLDRRGPADIPQSLLPVGVPPELRGFKLVRPDEITANEQWAVREAQYQLDQNEAAGLYPDPHCSYIVPAFFFLPFGAKAIIEGEFPHARFFSIQVSPPFDPRYYYYGGAFGAPEVPIVDVDIDPLPGHVNPFRIDADRAAKKRGYRVELDMVRAYGPRVEPAYRPPHYRAPGNRRKGSGIMYQGPLGAPGSRLGHGRGLWDTGALWLRYYAPDRDRGPLGGVRLPKLTFETASGRQFCVRADMDAKDKAFNTRFPIPRSEPKAPEPISDGRDIMWSRELGIFHTGVVALFSRVGKTTPADKAQGRQLIRGFTARGADMEAPGFWACSASRVPYISYLSGGGSLAANTLLVLTGRLPTHPKTLNGDRRMAEGQVRYFSITSYVVADFLNAETAGQPLTSLMDEEIVTDEQRRYVICYGRAEDRPRNATPANGITWVDWGPVGEANFNLRWLTVDGGWKDRTITPDDSKVSHDEASWLSERYDPSLFGINGRSTLMGEYVPTRRYLTNDEFERLGPAALRRILELPII